jgi:hypothetical protein
MQNAGDHWFKWIRGSAQEEVRMEDKKSRHGCLTAWLILMVIGNAFSALSYLLGGEEVRQNLPYAPGWVLPVLIVFSLFNLVCVIALFQWKKWGFWGFCVSAAVAFVVNLIIGLGIFISFFGLFGLAVLYGVLQIGKENKGWLQLD